MNYSGHNQKHVCENETKMFVTTETKDVQRADNACSQVFGKWIIFLAFSDNRGNTAFASYRHIIT